MLNQNKIREGVDWISYFLWHINHQGLFSDKAFVEEQQWYYLTHS